MTPTDIASALRRYLQIAPSGPTLGGAKSQTQRSRPTLRNDLLEIRGENRKWLGVHIGALVALFVVFLVLLVSWAREPATLGALGGATGLSFAWILRSWRRALEDKWQADLIMLTVEGLSQEAFDELALTLLAKLTRTDVGRLDFHHSSKPPTSDAKPRPSTP